MSVALLRDLASSPRPTGSDAIAAARRRVGDALRDLGFTVGSHEFEYSMLPGRWGTPIFGLAWLVIVGTTGHFGAAGGRYLPLLIIALGTIAVVAGGSWILRRGVLTLPLMRARGVNLEATPAGAAPMVWICAHLDSKSQPVPSLVRAAGTALAAFGGISTAGLAAAAALGVQTDPRWWAGATLVTLAGALPVMLSVVGTRSDGALDNASGVAAVIEAARQLSGRPVGVLITDAEELGLAGARAWARRASAGAVVLNCDGVDDLGDNVVMWQRRPPTSLLDGVERASRAAGISCRGRRLPVGILTDSVAFSEAGVASVTFSRGSFASLSRVHSRRDDLSRLRGTGIAQMAMLMAATAAQLGGWRKT